VEKLDDTICTIAADPVEARKQLVRIYLGHLPAWHDAHPETPVAPYGPDMQMFHTKTHIGFAYTAALNEDPFVEYRSTPSSHRGRLHVYGCTATGEVEYAGEMNSIKGAKAEDRRLRKAELQRLRHRTAPSWDGRRR
jgi:hypothetical protein